MSDHLSTAHLLMDCLLWVLAFCWFIGFLADHGRVRKKSNKRLGPPAKDCERTGKFEVRMCGLVRRQAE